MEFKKEKMIWKGEGFLHGQCSAFKEPKWSQPNPGFQPSPKEFVH